LRPLPAGTDDIEGGSGFSLIDTRRKVLAWVLLLAAGLLEVVWAFAMKLSEGFTRAGPATATLLAMGASVGLLAISMRSLPLSTAYPVWTGIGAVGTFAVGVVVLGEPLNIGRVVAAVLIVAGLILMRLTTPA